MLFDDSISIAARNTLMSQFETLPFLICLPFSAHPYNLCILSGDQISFHGKDSQKKSRITAAPV